MKKGDPWVALEDWMADSASERVEQEIGEEPVELDHDPGGDAEPDGGEHRGGGEELLHGRAVRRREGGDQRPGGRWLGPEERLA